MKPVIALEWVGVVAVALLAMGLAVSVSASALKRVRAALRPNPFATCTRTDHECAQPGAGPCNGLPRIDWSQQGLRSDAHRGVSAEAQPGTQDRHPAVRSGGELMRTLREARELRGMSQQRLADHLGVSQTAVHLWENGRASVTASTLVALTRTLGVGLDAEQPLRRGLPAAAWSAARTAAR